MIKVQTMVITIAALTVLPLSVYAAQADRKIDRFQESEVIKHSYLAQGVKHGKRGDRVDAPPNNLPK